MHIIPRKQFSGGLICWQELRLDAFPSRFRANMPPMRRAAFWILLGAVSLLVSGAFAGDETGQPAPRFRAKTMTGEQFNNESVKGKVVLFEFWTTWCKYCEGEAAMVDDIAKEFSGKGLIVLAVDVLEPDQRVKKYLADHPRSVPIVLTKDTNLAAMYNAQVYPIYVVVDRDGNIAGEQRGAGERGLRRMLRRAGLESEQ